MAEVIHKVRKGDAVAIEVTHSSTEANTFKTTRYTRFHLATVAAASRDGIAKRIAFGGQTHSIEVARIGRVLTLSDIAYRNAAKRLIERMTYPGKTWETVEALRESIIAETNANG